MVRPIHVIAILYNHNYYNNYIRIIMVAIIIIIAIHYTIFYSIKYFIIAESITLYYYDIIHAEPIGCNEGETRLADGGFSQRGRVEQCVNGVWGTVCDNKWDHTDAVTLCKTLGYPGTGNNIWCIIDNNCI